MYDAAKRVALVKQRVRGKHPPEAAARHLWTECRVYAAVHGADAGGGHICSAGTDRRMGRVRRDAAAGGRGRLCAGGCCLLCSSGGHHRAVLPAQEKRKSEKGRADKPNRHEQEGEKPMKKRILSILLPTATFTAGELRRDKQFRTDGRR